MCWLEKLFMFWRISVLKGRWLIMQWKGDESWLMIWWARRDPYPRRHSPDSLEVPVRKFREASTHKSSPTNFEYFIMDLNWYLTGSKDRTTFKEGNQYNQYMKPRLPHNETGRSNGITSDQYGNQDFVSSQTAAPCYSAPANTITYSNDFNSGNHQDVNFRHHQDEMMVAPVTDSYHNPHPSTSTTNTGYNYTLDKQRPGKSSFSTLTVENERMFLIYSHIDGYTSTFSADGRHSPSPSTPNTSGLSVHSRLDLVEQPSLNSTANLSFQQSIQPPYRTPQSQFETANHGYGVNADDNHMSYNHHSEVPALNSLDAAVTPPAKRPRETTPSSSQRAHRRQLPKIQTEIPISMDPRPGFASFQHHQPSTQSFHPSVTFSQGNSGPSQSLVATSNYPESERSFTQSGNSKCCERGMCRNKAEKFNSRYGWCLKCDEFCKPWDTERCHFHCSNPRRTNNLKKTGQCHRRKYSTLRKKHKFCYHHFRWKSRAKHQDDLFIRAGVHWGEWYPGRPEGNGTEEEFGSEMDVWCLDICLLMLSIFLS